MNILVMIGLADALMGLHDVLGGDLRQPIINQPATLGNIPFEVA